MCELRASADSSFVEEAGRLVTKLEAFLRPTDLLVKERHFRADWLPENETVAESVVREECHDVAREIFNRWVRKVREAVMVANQSIACELPWMAAWEPVSPQVVRRTSVT